MTNDQLIQQINQKKSMLCIGLDPDLSKLPPHLLDEPDPVFAFNKAIIEATHPYAIAYKPNIAFYEALGTKGWESLEKTLHYIPENIFTIADAKRGDIGNTSRLYAKTFFETYPFDAITVAPYMGEDSVKPFLEFENKKVILLALTSNKGSEDFQYLPTGNPDHQISLYARVLEKSQTWADQEKMMYVVGATQAQQLKNIRAIVPDHFLLIPGIGAQGGDLNSVLQNGINHQYGLLINASRSIIYAGHGRNFAEEASKEAEKMQQMMAKYVR